MTINVMINVRAASMGLSSRFVTDITLIFISIGMKISEPPKEAQKAMIDIRNMNETYALKVILMPLLFRLVCRSSMRINYLKVTIHS